jgi:hypothetical protein
MENFNVLFVPYLYCIFYNKHKVKKYTIKNEEESGFRARAMAQVTEHLFKALCSNFQYCQKNKETKKKVVLRQ